jgi:hypothetical protein
LEKAKKEIEARQLALDEYHKKLKTRILSL